MKINQLLNILKQQRYLTKQNLGLALDREGEDLNYWVKKLIKEDLLIPLKKGFYFSNYFKDEPIDVYGAYLANVLRFPSYLSLEYVLAKNNLIPESVFVFTSVTLKSSRTFKTPVGTFIYRNIKKKFFRGFVRLPLGKSGLTVNFAYPSKALFDWLYLKKFNSAKELRRFLVSEGRLNWATLALKEKTRLKQYLVRSGSQKMQTIAKILIKEKII